MNENSIESLCEQLETFLSSLEGIALLEQLRDECLEMSKQLKESMKVSPIDMLTRMDV